MDKPTVIIDNGSFTCRAGFAGQDAPSVEFRTVVGTPRITGLELGLLDHYVGDEALRKRGILTVRRPIEGGVITNWSDMEKIWHHLYHDRLKVAPEDHPVLHTESALNPKCNREKMMFEGFEIPAMYVAVQAVLSLYTSGRLTSVIFDSGHTSSFSVPVYEGHVIPHAVTKCHLTGHELTWCLLEMLRKDGHNFVTNAEYELVRDIKEKLCYVALDFEKEMQSPSSHESTYELPSGDVVTIGKPLFELPETLFQPRLAGFDGDGIHEICCDSIRRCDRDIQTEFGRNIVLSGGTTLFPGMIERFTKEMISSAPSTMMIKVAALPKREHSAWIGGSMLSSLPTFEKLCITKAEYDEYGPLIVHSKCF